MKDKSMNDEHLKLFCLELDQRGFSINEIQKAIITNHDIVLCLEDVEGLLSDAKKGEMGVKRAREIEVMKTLCEIKKRLVETDCSPLHKESEELYQTIWSVIGEHYGWNQENTEDIEDTEDQEDD